MCSLNENQDPIEVFLDNRDLEEVAVTNPLQNSFCATLKQ